MSHLVETMAYAGATPWHGLGNHLSEQQPLDVWLTEAGMDWRIEQSDVLFNYPVNALQIWIPVSLESRQEACQMRKTE